MIRSIIVAMANNGVIGVGGKMPWPHFPEDMQRFRQLTMNHHLIIGRKTHESIGKPLPGRITIVLSRSSMSLEAALATAEIAGEEEAFIGGGGEIYKLALDSDFVDRIYLTLIDKTFYGDTHFPRDAFANFVLVENKKIESPIASCQFQTWARTRKT